MEKQSGAPVISQEELLKSIKLELALARKKDFAHTILIFTKDRDEEVEVTNYLDSLFSELASESSDTEPVVYKQITNNDRNIYAFNGIELPQGAAGIALYKDGLDIFHPLDKNVGNSYLRSLNYDGAKKVPQWVIVGVLAKDSPFKTDIVTFIKPLMSFTFSLNE